MKEKYLSPTFREGCFLATPYNQNQSLAELRLTVLLEIIICMRKRPMSVLIRNNSSFLILISHSPKSSSFLELSLFSWNFSWGRQASDPHRQSTQVIKTSEINLNEYNKISHPPTALNCVSFFILLNLVTHFYFLSPYKYSLLCIIRIKH